MARDDRTESGTRIVPLGQLSDFEVAEGYPDIRGWRVDSVDGVEVGKVHELLVDVDVMRTRYLDVRLTSELAATPGDRDVLVPIGAAQIEDRADRVVVPLHSDRVRLLPPYAHRPVTRELEYEVRRHFALGETAVETGGWAKSTATSDPHAFYDNEQFDDKRFFSARHAVPTDASAATPATPASPANRDVRIDEQGVRIPVEPDETVVLKKGEGGRDEIIVRRPVDREQHRAG